MPYDIKNNQLFSGIPIRKTPENCKECTLRNYPIQCVYSKCSKPERAEKARQIGR